MTRDTRHVVFTPSGAGTLRSVLNEDERNDHVVGLFDDLSFGPIDRPDHATRPRWVEEQLGYTGCDEVLAKSESFWQESLSPGPRKIVWFSRRSAMEYAGFLEWLWRADDMPCDIIDLAEHRISRHPQNGPPTPPSLAVSLAELLPEEIRDNKLFDQSKPLQASERQRYHELWRHLRAENAPFRVTNGLDLRSAPMSFFDQMLLSQVKERWQKVGRIVGDTIAQQMDDRIHQTGDLVLAGRINALVNSGLLECQGDSPLNMRFSEVRLPQQAASPPTAAAG